MKKRNAYEIKNIQIEEKIIVDDDTLKIFNMTQENLCVMRMCADVKKLGWKHYHPVVAMKRVETDPKDRKPKEEIEKILLATIEKRVLACKDEPFDDDELDG